MLLSSKFPELYHDLLGSHLEQQVPTEKFANCADCHLCKTTKTSHYLAKCCTYHPILPNYIVGGILSDDESSLEEGQARIQKKVSSKVGVTPYGIIAPREFKDLITQRRKEGKLFILDEDERKKLTCPYLDNGHCTIWKYRSELCMTFFCHSVGGRFGSQYWNDMFHFITEMERKLSIYAIMEVGYPETKVNFRAEKIKEMWMHNPKGQFLERNYKTVWDQWVDNEINFYKECYKVIQSLDHEKTMKILGWESEQQLNKANALLGLFKENIVPDYLVYSTSNTLDESDPARVILENNKHKLPMNRRRYLGLKQFDGNKSTYEILRSSFGLTGLNSPFVQRMYLMGFLEKVDEKTNS